MCMDVYFSEADVHENRVCGDGEARSHSSPLFLSLTSAHTESNHLSSRHLKQAASSERKRREKDVKKELDLISIIDFSWMFTAASH